MLGQVIIGHSNGIPSILSNYETISEREQKVVKHIIATIFSSQDALRDLAPRQRWAGMGNLLGDYGEYIALSNYNLKKAPGGADGYDAVTADGLKVQIKANHSSSTIGFRGEADLLLVLKVENNAEWRELYYGPFKPVKEKATYSRRDNKYMIQIAKLQDLTKKASLYDES